MKVLKNSATVFFCLISFLVNGQDQLFKRYEQAIGSPRTASDFRIGFYNLENLFDPKDDSLTFDEAFTPEGDNRYTFYRYYEKSNGLGKTMLALGGWEPAEIIGLCEVENRWVVEGLTNHTSMKNAGYEIVHEDSPDRRGIDLALIYRPDRFNLILYKYYRVTFPHDPDRKTRDMLYVKGILPNQDTLHVFVNHWPSRWGGQFKSEPSRAYVASMLRQKVDSLNARFENPKIVICGDFNDEPDDNSIKDNLDAKFSLELAHNNDLVNLMYPIKYKYGTHSFGGEWGVLDQFIVTRSILIGETTSAKPNDVGIFDAPWLLTKNAAGNDVPFRSFQGPAYKGGYSDHLPIFLDLLLK